LQSGVKRIYVEKRKGFDIEAQKLYADLKDNLGVRSLEAVRIINRYDISGITDAEYAAARTIIFGELPVDHVYDEELPVDVGDTVFAVEYLPGQYDQRADSAAQCMQILTQKERPTLLSAKVIVLRGPISDTELVRIKSYCINPVESREALLQKPQHLEIAYDIPQDVAILHGFTTKSAAALQELHKSLGLAMSLDDLLFCQAHFRDTEKREPTITEIRVVDTYWSDHCRHTTFFTEIEDVSFSGGSFTNPVREAYAQYLASRDYVSRDNKKDICLMDIALMGMKQLRKQGRLEDLDESEEINACSITVDVDVDGESEAWLVMFKNETHNHPTEIEPFGGAATCLGGAIRDPLSGRSYVYQAMRVTGSADPRAPIESTLPGKLPQRKITTGAAAGYSSYGNQIGLATGQVTELYDEGFLAKRMEIGFVIGAAPRQNVVRQKPVPGDAIILVGGRTGRDGCGGATGSSKEHTTESLSTCGAEVQKGNPPTERKIQRLFRNPKVSRMIKKCNDFGAGGVSVAIGELTDGVTINLDTVPKKYEGMDGTELAISESQERMAVVVSDTDVDSFIRLPSRENLETTVVARVTSRP
jgi:phosphoribosylformylglycinamidine synthase